MKMVLAIAAGGALGAVGRHYVAHWAHLALGAGFPWGTLAVNVAGSFLMGVLAETLALAWSPGQEVRALLTVGFLGAFTTFSAFSLDVAALIERGAGLLAALYVAASVIVCVAALFAGLRLMRLVLG